MDGSEELKDIIRSVPNMSTRPEYFSGRGATRTDLDGEKLFAIQRGIKEKFGEDAAKNFAIMVSEIKVLSATTFLQELYRLEGFGWKYTDQYKESETGIEVPKNDDGEYSAAMGMLGVNNAMASYGNDDTYSIRHHFLMVNKIEPRHKPKNTNTWL